MTSSSGWPATMRIFARRERPHPGAKLSLFEHEDGYRYQLWVTNLPETTKGWRGKNAYIDAAHRVHARVEDAIRTGKDTGIGRFPSHEFEINQAWMTAAMTAQILLCLAQADRPGRRSGHSRAEDTALPRPERRRPPGPRRTPQTLEDRRELAMGRGDHPGLAADHRPPRPRLTCANLSLRPVETHPGPVEPRGTGPPAGTPSYPHSKIPAICTAGLAVSGSQLPA